MRIEVNHFRTNRLLLSSSPVTLSVLLISCCCIFRSLVDQSPLLHKAHLLETSKFMFADETLHPSSLVLKTYTDEQMEVMGTLNMQVQYGEQKKKLVLVVVGGNGPSLLGRNWLKHIKLDWSSIVAVRTIKMKPLHTLMQRHQQLFSEGLGLIEPFTATLHVRPDTTPRFFKPHQVPFSLLFLYLFGIVSLCASRTFLSCCIL